jgi:ribosomal protein S18 acetylase RimI-like enzyme
MSTVTRGDATARAHLEVRSTRDRSTLHAFLNQDRIFAAYAIADTDDSEFEGTRWGIAFDGTETVAVVMEYRGLSPQPVFAMGEPAGVSAVLRDVIRPRIAYLGARSEVIAAVRTHYRLESAAPMVRMAVDASSFRPVVGDAVRLDQGDTRHLNRLYQLGIGANIPSRAVAAGVYYGVRRGTRLIAAAGTHVISPQWGIAAVGNVFTDREHRGQGLAKVVTSAVTAELLQQCPTVVLNVRADNPPALAVYEALGYWRHVQFEERLIHRDTSLWDSIVGPVRALVSDLRRNG